MPKGHYDRSKIKPKSPQVVGDRRNHIARARLLPSDNASQPIQVCERLRARLTVTACAARFDLASTNRKQRLPLVGRLYSACEGCPIGEANSKARSNASTLKEIRGLVAVSSDGSEVATSPEGIKWTVAAAESV